MMLKFLTKKELWDSRDMGFVPRNPTVYHLKYAQDVAAMRYIGVGSNRVIGEIGADHSRVLPDLSLMGDDVYGIDVYDRSIGGGKTARPTDSAYKIFDCLVGENSSGVIPDHFFDITFSISVLEHVHNIPKFFEDNIRIMKPGGLILHMIDIYIDDRGIAFQPTLARECINFFKRDEVVPLEENVLEFSDFRFSTRFATNGDDMMYQWNRQVPSLKTIREESAVCCLMLGAIVKK
jgi:SAM-dependent methyltransferase